MWKKHFVSAGAFYILAIVLVFAPFFLSGKTFLPVDDFLMLYKPFAAGHPVFSPFNHFDDDILKFYYPYMAGARAHLYLPYWMPEAFGGIAQYANTYASHFSPLNWMLVLGPLHITYPLKLLISLWIAGMAMFAFARDLRLRPEAALLSGLAYMLSSLFLTLLLRWWLHAPFAWFPLVLLFSSRWLNRPHYSSVFGAALFLAFSFLDGFFQSSAAIVLALGIYLLAAGWAGRKYRGISRAVAGGSAILGLAFLFSAIMWLPQLEYFREDLAKGGSRVSGIYYGKELKERLFSIPLLVAALFPQAIGSVRGMDLAKFARSHLQDFSLFIGSIPLLLGLCTWPQRRRDPAVFGCWALAVLGVAIPVFTVLDRYFYFRFFAVYICGMSLLAGFGLESLLGSASRGLFRKLSIWALALLALITSGSALLRVFIWLRPGQLEGIARGFVEARLDQSTIGSRNPAWMLERAEAAIHYWSLGSWAYSGPLLLTFAALLLCLRFASGKLSGRAFSAGTVLITFLQLAIFARSWHGFHSLADFPLFPDNEIARFLRTEDPAHQFRSAVNDFHGIGKEKQLIPSNANYLYGYYTREGFDGVRPLTAYDYPAELDEYERLGEQNVKFILTNPEPLLTHPALRLRHKGHVAIYENKFAQPRARVFYDFERKNPEEMLRPNPKGKLPEKGKVWVEKMPEGLNPRAKAPTNDALLLSTDFRHSSYRLTNSEAGLLVATESFYPGWKAFLNGSEIPVLRANYALRGVTIPAGGGELEFRFEPESYRLGRWISLLSAGMAIFLLFALRRRCNFAH